MMVTQGFTAPPVLSAEQYRSIDLAIAQWNRSAKSVARAERQLKAWNVDSDELLRRRRADSADPALARLLRLAVTLFIARGRLEPVERARLAPKAPDATIAAVVEAVSGAYATMLLTESAAKGSDPDAQAVNLDVGDY